MSGIEDGLLMAVGLGAVLLTGVFGGGGLDGMLTFLFSEGLVFGGGGREGIGAPAFTSFTTFSFPSILLTSSLVKSDFLGRGLGAWVPFTSETTGGLFRASPFCAAGTLSGRFCSTSPSFFVGCCSVTSFSGGGLVGGALASVAVVLLVGGAGLAGGADLALLSNEETLLLVEGLDTVGLAASDDALWSVELSTLESRFTIFFSEFTKPPPRFCFSLFSDSSWPELPGGAAASNRTLP